MPIAQSPDGTPCSTPAPSAPAVGQLVAALCIGWPCATLVLTSLLFWLGMPIGPLHSWAGLALALVAGRLWAGSWRACLAAAAWLAAATVAGGAAVGWLYDFSGDGQWYHLPAVLGLAEGWNPLTAPQLADWNAGFEREVGSAAVYVQHYAKGAWIVAAAAYRATGLIEATKVFNLLYALAAYLVTAHFLRRIGLSRLWACAIALATAANPVVLYQMHSFFVDGQLAGLCTLLAVLSLEWFREPRSPTLVLVGACIVLLANVKFTGLVYAISLGGGLVALASLGGWSRQAGRYAAAGLVSVAIAVLVVGYQPYVTNYRAHGNPFYPALARDAAAEAATKRQFEIWAPPQFMAMGRLEKLTRSLFAESAGAEAMPRWKAPFTVSKGELYIFFNTEPRYGGFGPLFGSVLAVTLVGYLFAARVMARRVWTAGAALALLMALSALLNPEAWWARLSPQLWLVPLILLSAVALGALGWVRRAAAILVLLLLGNSALVAALSWGRAVEKNLAFRTQLARLQTYAASGPVEVTTHPSFRMTTERRLRSWSIDYRRAERPSCPTPFPFSYPAAAQAAACPGQGR
jgi:hypothetical protein